MLSMSLYIKGPGFVGFFPVLSMSLYIKGPEFSGVINVTVH